MPTIRELFNQLLDINQRLKARNHYLIEEAKQIVRLDDQEELLKIIMYLADKDLRSTRLLFSERIAFWGLINCDGCVSVGFGELAKNTGKSYLTTRKSIYGIKKKFGIVDLKKFGRIYLIYIDMDFRDRIIEREKKVQDKNDDD